MKTADCDPAEVFRNLLISLRLLNAGRAIHYSEGVPTTRWGEAITFYLAERGWTQKQLAAAASVRPNTLTNLIKHGGQSDTATLSRIAKALEVDLADLFLTREQIEILRTHKENKIDRLKEAVLKELSQTVEDLVQKQLQKGALSSEKPTRETSRRNR